jgi:uncharacterized repeat protein (TIGR01451 family)
VTVTAANINSDGVPNNADALDQDFALVIYNSSDSEVLLVPAGATIQAESCAGQGVIDPGETVTVNLALRNFGRSNTTSLVATLLPVGGVISPGGQQTYGTLSGNGAPAVSRPFTFVAGGPCGSDVIVTLQLQDGTNDYGTVEFPFRMGTLTTNNTSSSNVSPITITASNSAVTPYPSPIWIGNVQGKISRVTVTLDGLSHSWPDDLDVLLVGPQRQAIMLLSDAGGGSDVTNLTLVFDSSAILALPDDTPLTSGTWRPTDYSTDVSLPAPAPTAPYAVSMSSLLGRTPNGFWRLYVADDYGSDDGGQVLRGWSVTLTVTNPLCCVESTSADLALTVSDTPDPISVSNVVTYTLRVINNGPAAASDVTLLGTLPSGVAFLQATLSQGNYTQTNNVVTCNFGNLIAGNSATATINAQVIGGPQVETTASVTAAESDPNPVNNVASATTSVTVPSLAVQNTTAIEGNTGTNFAVFLLALSQPSAQVVQVSYFTTNGTALAGLDYMAVSNQAALLPGEIAYSIKVPIIADVVDENDKTFGVWLANPLNASLSNAFANATILDDDPSPAVSISNAALAEGNTGTTNAVFSISLSAPSSRSIQVSCSTGNGTALAGEDFIAFTNRPVAFAPGQTVSNIAVTVKGDIEAEPNETFTVVLSNPTNAVLGAAVGTGTIMSDDLAPLIQAVDYRIEAESGTNNGVIEPGEVITVSLALINNGSANTTNLVATLQPTGGVNSPSNPQTYGVLQAGGPQISRSFSFTVGTSNCGTLRLSFALDDAGASHGTIAFDQPVGNCFYDDFEPNIDLAQWSSLGGILGSTLLATNHGGSVSPVNSLWFSDNGSRFAATRAINTLGGGVISFYLRLANGTISGRWETVDLPTEAVVLEYSTNNGVAWTPMASYSNASYYAWTGVSESIPPAAQTAATLFRWRQLAHSGSCCDQWALDDVAAFIGPQPPVITTQPQSQTAISGSGVILNVTAAGSSPLSYQWRLFGTNLPGATTEVLTLINVTSNKAGPYSVIVTNLFGSTVSSNALVSVVPGISLSQAVDAPELIWTTGGNSNWVGQAGVTHDGADAAQTGGITHSQTNWLQTTVTGPGMLTFWWKVSSEADFDYLRFAVDANVQASLAGEVNWQQRTHLISTGAHTLRWTYAKDAGGNAGQDKAWVDQVVFTPDFGALHHFVWNPIGSTQTVNVPFPVTLTAQDTANNPVTNYSGAPNLSAYALVGQNVGTILDNPVHTTGNNGDWTLGYAFTPNKNLVVTHVRHYFGNRVSIWTDSGTLLASQNVVGPSGTWTETELTTPLQLVAGTGYRVGVYNGGGAYYWRTDLGTTFADGTIDQSYSISGDAFPSDADPIHWWLVNLRYVVGSTVPVVITPTIAGTFVNGVWSGSITASQAGTNVSLLASDGSGRNGVSSSFVVALPPSAPPVILQQPAGQTVSTGHSATFNVLANGTQPLLYQWRLNGTNLSGATNSALMLSDVTVNDTGNYSVVVSNSVGSAISSNALLTVVAPSGLSALLIWDSANGGTAALSNALAKAGIAVTLSSAVENSYDGSNPSPGVFNVVIHLNGTTYNDDMPLAGQNMLVNYVQSGGGYIHSEWDAYEYGAGRMLKMRDLILLDCAGFSEGNVSVSDVPAQSGHPILANVPSNFTFQAGFNIGPAHVFPTNPVTVLMRDLGMNDAVVIREFGSGRIVGFSHAGNYDGGTAFETLLNTNVQRLYVDAVLWAARSATNPPAIAIQPPSILSDGSFALWLKHTDGSPITPAEAAYTYLYWTTNIAVPFATWQPASNPLVLTNGMLRVGGLNISNAARQFFRAEQTP